jgi:hypothetical protein
MSDTVVNLPAQAQQKREIQTVIDPVPILDTSRFEHMQRVAAVMARSTMIPESLRTMGTRDKKEDLPFEQVLSNCFLVVNQAARWGMDPFSVISCCSVVHGRLAYEGKLVAAVIDAKVGVRLHYHFTGDPATDAYRIYLSDHPFTAELITQLKPGLNVPGLRLWDGSVGEWKTTGAGTPWTTKNYRRMLIYRGTRDWTRIYESAVLLGVYTDDELMDLAEDARARRATPVLSLADRLAAAKAPGNANAAGFSYDHVTQETEAQREATDTDSPPSPASKVDEAEASDQEPVSTGSEGVQDRVCESTPSPDSNSPEHHPSISPVDGQADTSAEVRPTMSSADNLSESSPQGPGASDDGDGTSSASPSPSLPEGTLILYAAALRRAQKKESLAKYAKQFWDEKGGWEKWKNTPDGATASAIFDAFRDHFGNQAQIELQLRELI